MVRAGNLGGHSALKILHVVQAYLPSVRYGGPIRSVANLCGGLTRLKHSCTVCTTDSDGVESIDVPLETPVTVDNVPVYYFKCPGWHYYAYSPSMRRWLVQNAGGFDVIHVHGVWSFPQQYACRAARRNGVPYILSPRGSADARIAKQRLGLGKLIYVHLYDRANIRGAGAIHYTSPGEQAHSLIKGREGATCVVPNPVSRLGNPTGNCSPAHEARNSLERIMASDYVLSVGRISWTKGIDVLIGALARLAPQWSHVKLAVVGPDTEGLQRQFIDLARRSGVAERVLFLGTHTGETLRNLYGRAKLLAAPAVSEGFGNTVAEAMLEGTPVVATSSVGIVTFPEIGECVRICDRTVEATQAAIESVMTHHTTWKNFAEKGRSILETRFSVESVAEEMAAVYRRVPGL